MNLALIIFLIWLGGWVVAVLLYLVSDGMLARIELLVIFIMWPLQIVGSVCLILPILSRRGDFS
jgi:hypothetical protein